MRLYPAIDLKSGQAVRLLRGEMDSATVFNSDPADQAIQFAKAGFDWIHVVDLDGAFAGGSRNGAAVKSILDAVELKIQLGGGIRKMADIEAWLEAGVSRVILGTVALKNPELVRAACRAHPQRIVVGIDARGGYVATEGWAEKSEITALDLAKRFEDAGVAAIIYTDIDRDGALQGANVQATADLARSCGLPIIASGGVSSLADLEALLAVAEAGIEGVISGRAIYDGRLDPGAALALLHGERATC